MNISRNSARTPWPRADSVAVERDRLRVWLKDGREISVPFEWFNFLADATAAERQRFEVDELGATIYWDLLSDSISVPSLFGLPEDPPRVRRDTYVIEYRHDGRRWIAELPDFESNTPARTLAAAKRDARELLQMLLGIEDMEAAGIEVIDDVHPREAVGAT